MENQQSYQCFNNQLCRRQYKVKPKQMGGQRIVQSQIHFIIIIFKIFFTIQVVLAVRWKQSVKLIV